MPPHGPSQVRRWRRSPRGQILLACLAIAAFFLIMGHRAPGLDVLPYILFLLGPVLHLFRHGWHCREHAGQHQS